MAQQLSGFKRPEDTEVFRAQYDELLAAYWPDLPREELDVPTSFGTTRVRRTGTANGTPIVMIHPTMGSSIGLFPFIARLAADRTVYTPDTIGTPGRSDQTDPVSSVEALAAWLDETLGALDLDRVHLVGYSEGGFVACIDAALTARPERLASLTLIEPGGAIGDLRKRTLFGIATGGIKIMFARDKRAAMRRLGHWMNGSTVDMPDDVTDFVQFSSTKFRYRIPRPKRLTDDQLRRIACPTLLMLGENSRLFDARRLAERTRKLLPNLTTYIEPDGGHGFGYDNPDATMNRVLGFINEHDHSPTT